MIHVRKYSILVVVTANCHYNVLVWRPIVMIFFFFSLNYVISLEKDNAKVSQRNSFSCAALKEGTGISVSIHKPPLVTVGEQFPFHNVRIYTFHGKWTQKQAAHQCSPEMQPLRWMLWYTLMSNTKHKMHVFFSSVSEKLIKITQHNKICRRALNQGHEPVMQNPDSVTGFNFRTNYYYFFKSTITLLYIPGIIRSLTLKT